MPPLVLGPVVKIGFDIFLKDSGTKFRNATLLIEGLELFCPIPVVNPISIATTSKKLKHIRYATKYIRAHIPGVTQAAWPCDDVKILVVSVRALKA
jgi:hypothetical protein